MAITYKKIASTTLTGNQASVVFSGISSAYTDLVLRMSIRGNVAATAMSVQGTFNSNTSSYSGTALEGTGTTATSLRNAVGTTAFYVGQVNGANGTTNTFSNHEIYIPSYLLSQNKPSSVLGVLENNSTTQFDSDVAVNANLWSNTAAITSITIAPYIGANNFVSGSTFYLYGIKSA